MKIIKDKCYLYEQLESKLVHERNLSEQDTGSFVIGQNILTYKDGPDILYQFILDGYSNQGIYKCTKTIDE